MFKFKKIKLKKFSKFFKRLPRIFAERTFLSFFVLFVCALLLTFFIFFQYIFSAQIFIKLNEGEKLLEFKEEVYETVLNEWEERNTRFLEIDLKEYPNPFRID